MNYTIEKETDIKTQTQKQVETQKQKESDDHDDSTQTKKTIIKKPNFLLTRNKKNQYQIDFVIENKYIHVKNMLNFNLLKFIYEVNKNYFEKVQLDEVNSHEAKLYLLMKPIMKELGILQRFASLHVKMSTDQSNNVYFKGTPCAQYDPIHECKYAIIAPIKEFTITCTLLSPHKFKFSQTLFFDMDFTMLPFFENIFGTLLKNIFQQTIKAMESIK